MPSVDNQTTLHRITGPGGRIQTKGQGTIQVPKIVKLVWKKEDRQKREGQRKGTHVLNVPELADLSIQTAQSIDFSCYKVSEKVEWFLDSGCTDHITPRKSDFIQYIELGQASKAEIANGKHLTIEGYGTVIGHSIMLNRSASLQMQNVL